MFSTWHLAIGWSFLFIAASPMIDDFYLLISLELTINLGVINRKSANNSRSIDETWKNWKVIQRL